MNSKKLNSLNNVLEVCNQLLLDLDLFYDMDIVIKKSKYKITKTSFLGKFCYHFTPFDIQDDDDIRKDDYDKEYSVYINKNIHKYVKFTEDGIIAFMDENEGSLMIFTDIVKDENFIEFKKRCLVNHIPTHLKTENLININCGLKVCNYADNKNTLEAVSKIAEYGSKGYTHLVEIQGDLFLFKSKEDKNKVIETKNSDEIGICELTDFDDYLINTFNMYNLKKTIVLAVQETVIL